MKIISENWKDVHNAGSFVNFIKEFAKYLISIGYCGFPRVSQTTTILINQEAQKSLAARSITHETKENKRLIELLGIAALAFGVGFGLESTLQIVKTKGTDLLKSFVTTEVMAHNFVKTMLQNTPLLTGLVFGLAISAYAYKTRLFQRQTRDLTNIVKEDKPQDGASQEQEKNEARDFSNNVATSIDQEDQGIQTQNGNSLKKDKSQDDAAPEQEASEPQDFSNNSTHPEVQHEDRETQDEEKNSVANRLKLFENLVPTETDKTYSSRLKKSCQLNPQQSEKVINPVVRTPVSSIPTHNSTVPNQKQDQGMAEAKTNFANVKQMFENQGIPFRKIPNVQHSEKEKQEKIGTIPTATITTDSQIAQREEHEIVELKEQVEDLKLKEILIESIESPDPVDETIPKYLPPVFNINVSAESSNSVNDNNRIDQSTAIDEPTMLGSNLNMQTEARVVDILRSQPTLVIDQESFARLKAKAQSSNSIESILEYKGPYEVQVQSIEKQLQECDFDFDTETWVVFVKKLVYGQLLLIDAEKTLDAKATLLSQDLFQALKSLIDTMKLKLKEEIKLKEEKLPSDNSKKDKLNKADSKNILKSGKQKVSSLNPFGKKPK